MFRFIIPFSGRPMQILDSADYEHISNMVQNIPFNTLFIRVILQGRVKGTIYVNDWLNPDVCLAFHPYGMLLLSGRIDNAGFNHELKDFLLNTYFPRPLWLQVYPPDWSNLLSSLLGDRLVKYPSSSDYAESEREFGLLNRKNVVETTRVNFTFNPHKYFGSPLIKMQPGLKIIRINAHLFETMPGTVIPRYFWNSFEDFLRGGLGFSVLKDDELLSTCCSAFAIDNFYEIGIQTVPGKQGKGYAELACRAYIDYCLAQGYEPVWSCRKENLGSYKLALKLGFEPTLELPYYSLVNNQSG
jgi:hypothetical protein